jgi:tetratricopeptide (TPR) repeat protein
MGRIALVLVMLCAGTVAHAQPKAEGTRLFEEGRELAKAGKFAEACEAFQKSFAIDRAPGTSLNYGDCLEKLGQLRKAWQMYDDAAREFDKLGDARGKFARERATAVAPKLGTLTVKVAEPKLPGLVVKIANESLPPQAQMVERYEPGSIEVTATAPGRTAFTSTARTAAGANVIVEIPPLAASDGTTTTTTTTDPPELHIPPVPPPEMRRNPARVKLAIGLGAVGGGAVILGGILALSARSSYNDAIDSMKCSKATGKLVCNLEGADQVNSAGTRANLATAFTIGGGLLAATAVVLFVTAPREALYMRPTVTANSVGVGISGAF